MGGLLVIPGALGAVRRDVLESLGRLHADTLTEDSDLTIMIHKTKGKIAFAPEAIDRSIQIRLLTDGQLLTFTLT